MYKRFISLTLLLPMLLVYDGWGQVAVNSGTIVTENFTGFTGASTPSNWAVQGTGTGGTSWRGTNQSGGTSGGWYGNENMSFLGSGTASNGNGTWILQNKTGATITNFKISFVGRLWKTGTASPQVTVSWSKSSSSTNPSQGTLANTLSSLTFSDATANISTGATLTQDVTSASISNDEYIFIRFIHAGGSSSDNLGWDDVTFSPEPTSATSLTFGDVQPTSMTINWTNGNGAGRAVFVREGDAGSITAPSDGTAYTSSTDWSAKGDQLGISGYYCAYSGSSNTVSLTNLSEGTAYYVYVYEYNGSGTSINYKTTDPATSNQTTTTSGTPTITLSTSSLSSFGTSAVGSASGEKTFTITGTDLNGSDPVIVTPPAGFQVSLTSGSGFTTDPLEVSSDPDFGPTTMYAIFQPLDAITYSSVLTVSGGGATEKTVAVSGNGIEAQPTTQATAATVASSSDVTLSLNWTNGNGSSRLVLMKQGSAVVGTPVDGTSYTADLAFGTGSEIGTGNRVVYAGSDPKPITVTGLTAGESYHIAVFEYNGSGGTENYLTTSPATASAATLKITAGAVATSPFCVDATNTASGTIVFTVTGVFGAANDYTAWLSDNLGSFTSEVNIGTLENTTGEGSINITIPAGTVTGTGYKIRIKSNDPTEIISGPSVAFTILNGPQDVTSAVATNANLQSVLSWTNPAGCYDEIMIVGKSGADVTLAPSGDGTAYTGSLTFGSGTPYDGGFVIYKGISSPQTVTNLTNDITYHFTFFTRSGTAWSAGVTKTANPSSGTLLLEENFSYSVGAALTSNNWTVTGTTATPVVSVNNGGGLSYSNYGPLSAGNGVTLATSGQDVNRTFTAQASGNVYAAFLVNVTSAQSGDYFVNLGPNPMSTTLRGRVFVKSTDGGIQFGLAFNTEAATYSPTVFSLSTTYLLVLKYEVVSGDNNDRVSLYVFENGDVPQSEPSPTISNVTVTGADIVGGPGAFGLRQGNASNAASLTIDAIRVSTGWFGSNGALPVELTSFTARAQGTSVILNWETKTEIDNNGFEVERNANGTWQKIGFVEGHGTANSPKYYSFSDANPLGNKIQYRLKQIDNDGDFEYSDVVEVELAPVTYTLYQNYPNPFNPSTVIRYALPVAGMVTIDVFNALGEKVATLLNGEVEAGYNQVSFDAANLPSGLYFYRIQSGDFTSIKKMLLMK